MEQQQQKFKGKKNMLIIAMGGSSGKIASALKQFWGNPSNEYRQFLLLDTEEFDRQEFEYDNITKEEYIYLGGENLQERVSKLLTPNATDDKLREKKDLMQCFDIENHVFRATLPNYTLNLGAGRKRYVGRMLLYYKRGDVSKIIKPIIQNMSGTDNNQLVSVMLISSCCGGTGSSMFHDIFRLVNSLGNVETYPVVIGPTLFVTLNGLMHNDLAEQMKLNAFAFFEELSVYLKFPEVNYSFLVESNKSFNIKNILYFDDRINEGTYLSSIRGESRPNKEKFYQEVAKTLANLFPMKAVTLLKNNGKGTGDELWRLVANMDELLQTEYEYGALKERRTFISVTCYENNLKQEFLLSVIKALLSDSYEVENENVYEATDENSETNIINSCIEGDLDLKYIEPLVSDNVCKNEYVKIPDIPKKFTFPLPVLRNSLVVIKKVLSKYAQVQSKPEPIINDSSSNYASKGLMKKWWDSVQNIGKKNDDKYITESEGERKAKEDARKIIKELEVYMEKIDNVIVALKLKKDEIESRGIKPVQIEIQAANEILRDLYLDKKYYKLIFFYKKEDDFFTKVVEYTNNRFKNTGTGERTEVEISKSVPAYVTGVSQNIDYAVFQSENSQIKLYAYIALNQRNYRIWSDVNQNKKSYIESYYSHTLSNNNKFIFFPHIDKRFEPVLRGKHTKISEYLDDRRVAWHAEIYYASKSSEIEDVTYTKVIAYAAIASLLNWKTSPITIKHKKGTTPADDYGYFLEFKMITSINEILKINK